MTMALFPIPVYMGPVRDKEAIDRVLSELDLKNETERLTGNAKVDSVEWNCNVRTSCDSRSQDPSSQWGNDFMHLIKPNIDEYVNDILTNPKMEVDYICNSPWINVYERGDHQELHDHLSGRNMLSFSYFHKIPEGGARFRFKSPLSAMTFAGQIDSPPIIDTVPEKRFYIEKDGDIFIFPSWLPHMVTPHNCDEIRVTISGNLTILKRGTKL